MNSKLLATLLSIAFFVVFVIAWGIATKTKKVEINATTLDKAQITEVTTGALTEPDVQTLAGKGLTFEQIKQISYRSLLSRY